MDRQSEWATKLAEVAAPYEADLAPLIAARYREGGQARRQLFEQAGGEVGGFGAVDIPMIFPWLLNGLVVAAPALYAIVKSDALSNISGLVATLLSIHESLEQRAQKPQEQRLAEQPYASLRRFTEGVTRELQAAGIEEKEAERLTLRVLHVLLQDPPGAVNFVQKLEDGAK